MRNRILCCRFLGMLLAIFGTSAILSAQATAGPYDLPALLARMKANTRANGLLVEQFTSDETWHHRNWNQKGKLTVDVSARFENVFVEGLPYRRKVEENGKPLTGKAAAKEEEQYEKSVSERKAMSADQKRGFFHRTFQSSLPDCCLATLFDNRILRHEALNGRETLVVESTPKPGAHPGNEEEKSALHWKQLVWIGVQDTLPARYEWELLSAFGHMLPGTKARVEFERRLLDPSSPGERQQVVWLQHESETSSRFKLMWIQLTGKTEQNWSSYKRFKVDMRLLQDSVQPVPTALEP